jgi:flagellar hook-associated protein 1 FlgK
MIFLNLLSIARSALLTHQRAMSVTAHNIANANTPGYSRQRLRLQAAEPLRTPLGALGRGVSGAVIERARDRFADAAFRRESGGYLAASTLRDHLDRVEAAIGEPSEIGLASALDGFFQSWSDLAAAPGSPSARSLLQRAAARLTDRFHQHDATLRQAVQDAGDQLRRGVEEINQLSVDVARLNAEILASGGAEGGAADLADQRDRAADRLAELTGARVLERPDGTLAVVAGDTLVVDGGQAAVLEVVTLGSGGLGVGVVGGGAVRLQSGALHSLSELTSSILPGLAAELDRLAASVIDEINAVHRSGWTLGGATGTDFFDAAQRTAGAIDLTAAVRASGDAIAAGATAAPGDADVALRIAALAHTGVAALGGRTLRAFWIDTAASLGSRNAEAARDVEVGEILVGQAEDRRAAGSAVSIDEEMVGLIGQQQAYSAAARLVQVVQDLTAELMRLI